MKTCKLETCTTIQILSRSARTTLLRPGGQSHGKLDNQAGRRYGRIAGGTPTLQSRADVAAELAGATGTAAFGITAALRRVLEITTEPAARSSAGLLFAPLAGMLAPGITGKLFVFVADFVHLRVCSTLHQSLSRSARTKESSTTRLIVATECQDHFRRRDACATIQPELFTQGSLGGVRALVVCLL